MKLKQLMPLDLYIYEYVKQLFDQRWRVYVKERSKKQFEELRVNGNAMTTLSLPDTIMVALVQEVLFLVQVTIAKIVVNMQSK